MVGAADGTGSVPRVGRWVRQEVVKWNGVEWRVKKKGPVREGLDDEKSEMDAHEVSCERSKSVKT